MLWLGFSLRWADKVKNCVSLASFRVLINGHAGNSFSTQRGFRQGCRLSSFLFIICAEKLLGLISNADRRGLIQGLRVAHGAPAISHLFFIDNTFSLPEQLRIRLNHEDIYYVGMS